MTSPRDVVLTGIGVSSPFGDETATWLAAAEGRSAVRMLDVPGVVDFPRVPGAPWLNESPVPFLSDRKLAKYMSPAASMAVIAAGRALRSAKLLDDAGAKRPMGLFVATGLIAFDLGSVQRAVDLSRSDSGELDLIALGERGLRACHPLMPFKMLLNMSLGLVSIAYGLCGTNFVVYPDAVQSGVCLERAVRAIRAGSLERALVGGTCQGLSLMPVATRSANRALAATVNAARPFVAGHEGQAPADAAAFLAIESYESALTRGATPVARIDDVHLETRNESTVNDAGIGSRGEAPDLWVSTGNRREAQDRAEMAALDAAWPGRAPRVVSFDACWGDAMAASLPLALGATATMMARKSAWPMAWNTEHGTPPSRLLVNRQESELITVRSARVRATNGTGSQAVVSIRAWEADA